MVQYRFLVVEASNITVPVVHLQYLLYRWTLVLVANGLDMMISVDIIWFCCWKYLFQGTHMPIYRLRRTTIRLPHDPMSIVWVFSWSTVLWLLYYLYTHCTTTRYTILVWCHDVYLVYVVMLMSHSFVSFSVLCCVVLCCHVFFVRPLSLGAQRDRRTVVTVTISTSAPHQRL